jgi:hypothetical protein
MEKDLTNIVQSAWKLRANEIAAKAEGDSMNESGAAKQGKAKSVEDAVGTPVWARDIKREWIVENLIEKDVTTMFVGPAGGGKSFVVLDMVRAIAQGRKFAGLKTRQSPVLYLDRENSDAVVKTRLMDVLGFKPHEGDEKRLVYWGGWAEDYPESPDNSLVKKWVQENPGCVVVFDSFVRFNPGEENSATDVAAFFDKIDRLKALGASIILIHHTGKSGGYRGSSDILGAVSSMYIVNSKNHDDPDPENGWKSRKILDYVSFKTEKARGSDTIAGNVQFWLEEGKGFVMKFGKHEGKVEFSAEGDAKMLVQTLKNSTGPKSEFGFSLSTNKLSKASGVPKGDRFSNAVAFAIEKGWLCSFDGSNNSTQYTLAEGGNCVEVRSEAA